jgi:uncharacterized Zn finger protein
MGDWYDHDDDNYDGYDSYEWSGPRRVRDGIKARSTQGAIGKTWWSKRWVRTLESFGMGQRLSRGRFYARLGQVISIDVEAGIVKSQVQGSQPEPYIVQIRLHPLVYEEWESVIDVMASQAIFAAKLLAGEMPADIEEAFSSAHVPLFPAREQDLSTKCSCPDWANPCKHTAAVYYILAERFDEDPFLLFKLRGRTREEIIEELRVKRADSLAAEVSSSMTVIEAGQGMQTAPLCLEDNVATFWQAGEELETFQVHPGQPEVARAVLKRLGDAPFAIGQQNMTELLANAYDSAAVAITQTTNDTFEAFEEDILDARNDR